MSFYNFAQSTLAAACTDSATSITVNNPGKFPAAPHYARLDGEIVLVTSKSGSGGSVWAISRAQQTDLGGGAATNHSSGSVVEATLTALDANSFSTFGGDYDDLTNKPELFSGDYDDLTNKPTLATVATTGDYDDLSGKPTLGSAADNAETDFVSVSPATTGRNTITAAATTATPLLVKGMASQSADIFGVQNSAAANHLRVQSDGTVKAANDVWSFGTNSDFNCMSGNLRFYSAGGKVVFRQKIEIGTSNEIGAADTHLLLKAHASQTADPIKLTSSTDTTIFKVAADGSVTSPQFTSTIASGNAPFAVSSTTVVGNLNADLLDGKESTAFVEYASAGVIAAASGANLTNVDAATLGGTPLSTLTAATSAAQTTADNAASAIAAVSIVANAAATPGAVTAEISAAIGGVMASIPTNNASLTNGAGYITSAGVPTTVSSFTNDSGYITAASLPSGFSGSGTYTSFTFNNGICTSAS